MMGERQHTLFFTKIETPKQIKSSATHELTSSSFLSKRSFSLHTSSWSRSSASLVLKRSEFSLRSASFSRKKCSDIFAKSSGFRSARREMSGETPSGQGMRELSSPRTGPDIDLRLPEPTNTDHGKNFIKFIYALQKF